MYLFLSCFIIRFFFLQEFLRQHYILQRSILGEQIERLEHQPEMESLSPDLIFLHCSRIIRIEKRLRVYADHASIRPLQEIQAAQECRLSASRRSDKREHLPLFQRKTDIFQYLSIPKTFAYMLYFQYRHMLRLLSEILQFFL